MQMLMDSGADVDPKADDGHTPLQLATATKKINCVSVSELVFRTVSYLV